MDAASKPCTGGRCTLVASVKRAGGGGALVPVIKAVLAAVAAHNASLVGDTGANQLGQNNGALQSCCGGNCSAGCNYPNPNPR